MVSPQLATSLSAAKDRLADALKSVDSRDEIGTLLRQQEETIQRALLSRVPSRFVVRHKSRPSSSTKLLKGLRSRRALAAAGGKPTSTRSSSSSSSSSSIRDLIPHTVNRQQHQRRRRHQVQQEMQQQLQRHLQQQEQPLQSQQQQPQQQQQQQQQPSTRSISVSSEFLSGMETLLASAAEGLRRIELLQQQAAASASFAGGETPRNLRNLEETLRSIAETAQQLTLRGSLAFSQQQQQQQQVSQRTLSSADISEVERAEVRDCPCRFVSFMLSLFLSRLSLLSLSARLSFHPSLRLHCSQMFSAHSRRV